MLSIVITAVIGGATGTGAHAAVAASAPDLAGSTLYHPLVMPAKPLPLLLWGNGGCRGNGLRYAQFLREIASHGFFIVAAGDPKWERLLQPPGAPTSGAAPPAAGAPEPDEGRAPIVHLQRALDWAIRVNGDPASEHHGRIDTKNVGVMGTSCGGLQAIAMSTDPRVKTAIGFNTGVLLEPPPSAVANADLVVGKEALAKINGPIAYINGGPTDIAHPNALDDLKHITHVPVFFGENGVGHGGTYLFDGHGGDYAKVATAWFSWQLKGDAKAAQWFRGTNCTLCTMPGWSVRKKQFYGE